MESTKPILFVDFDGTICHDRFWRSLSPELNEQVQNFLFRHDTARVMDWMLGKYSAEEINQLVAEEIGMPFSELWALFVDDCMTMHIPKGVLRRLSELRERFTVILITGNMDSFSRFTVPALKLDRYFDVISNSFHEGKHKTDRDGEIFRDYAEKFQADLSDCVLVDDSESACAIFAKLGGKSCHITPAHDIEYYLSILENAE